MSPESRSISFARRRRAIPSVAGKAILLLVGPFCGLLLCATGCMTRSSVPVYGTDSTLVYPSRLANDVNASITFQLKDSALRDAERKRDRERGREISRMKRDRAKLLAAIERETDRREKAEAKRKAQEARKARKAKGKKGKRSSGGPTEVRDAAPATPAPAPMRAVAAGSRDAALRDSLAAIETRLAALSAEDSVSSLAPWKIKRADGRPPDERVVDLEDGARVQANIRLDNVYARGKRPLMLHFVWLNPARKRVFKKIVEYTPNDSTQTLSSSLTISPAKRSSGEYAIQVFLFREQIAEKTITLRGAGVEEQEKGGSDAM